VPSLLGCDGLMLGANRTTPREMELLTGYSFNATWWVNDYAGGANLADMLRVELMRSLATDNATGVAQAYDVLWSNVQVGNATANWQGIVQDGVSGKEGGTGEHPRALWPLARCALAFSSLLGAHYTHTTAPSPRLRSHSFHCTHTHGQPQSFHFHGEDPLTSAYGAIWLSDQLQLLGIANGTAYTMPPARAAALAYYIAVGVGWTTYGRGWDWATQGRGVDRPGTNFNWGLPLELVALVGSMPGAEAWAGEVAAFVARQSGAPGAPPLVRHHHFWNSDLTAHHRPAWGASVRMHSNKSAAGYAVMGSECDNYEDMLAEHFGDGVVNVYALGADGAGGPGSPNAVAAGYEGVFPLLDWQALNGITVEHDVPIEPCGSGDVWPLKWTAYVGGVSDGLYGATAMDTATHGLTGKRAWFFLDSVLIGLGAGLTDASPANVRTSLAQRLAPAAGGGVQLGFVNGTTVTLPDGEHALPADAAATVAGVVAGGVGVVPLLASLMPSAAAPGSGWPSLGIEASLKTAPWSTIGPYTGTATGRTFSAWLDHGTGGITGGGYAYALAPNMSAPFVMALGTALADPRAASALCGVNSPGVQAVGVADVDLPGGGSGVPRLVEAAYMTAAGAGGGGSLTMAAFYDAAATVPGGCGGPGAFPSVAVDTPAMVIVAVAGAGSKAPGALTVTVANPVAVGGSVTVTVGGAPATRGAGCAAAPGGGGTAVTVTMPAGGDAMGSSVTVTCGVA
jgi:hypothetical protein